MAEYQDREHFIPLRRSELVELLCSEKDLPREEREPFRQFCRLVSATYHFEYHQQQERLKDAYAPFDPDADTKALTPLSPEEKHQRLDDLFKEFTWLMERANFKRLRREDIEAALAGASDWGINMDVDLNVFDRYEIFARGDTVGKRSRRRLRNGWRLEEISLPVYQRLVLILKLRPHRRLGRQVDTDSVYLKAFKDIPKMDLEMLLPGARVRITRFDQGKIGFPLLTGLALVLWKIGHELLAAVTAFVMSPYLLWTLATGTVGYGVKSYFGYQTTKQRYSLTLTQSLYYQNLDSNAGVFFRLLDEAEEQECREAILAYYFLWRYAGDRGWTGGDLDDYIEMYLEGKTKLKVDFEIDDALAKLEKLGLVERIGDRYRARPLPQALELLDYTWDNHFQYNNPQAQAAPVPATSA
jgi:hypothetical protein